MALKKVVIISSGCHQASFDINGKSIVITPYTPYLTSNPVELNFFATQRHIGLMEPSEKEVISYTYDVQNLPSILRDISENLASALKYRPDIEGEIREELSKAGFKFVKDDTVPVNEKRYDNFETEKMIETLESRGYAIIKVDRDPEEPVKDDVKPEPKKRRVKRSTKKRTKK
jgi:hypothetical protein